MLPSNERLPLIGIPVGSQKPNRVAGAPNCQFNSNYPAAIAGSGGIPLMIPLGLPESVLRALFVRLDGLCLAGGDDVDPQHYGEPPHPKLKTVDALRDASELLLARWALAARLPLFGICRGVQLMNVAAGGDLYQDIEDQVANARRHSYTHSESPWERPTHRVNLASGSRLAQVLGHETVMTNSFHHQAVRRLGTWFAAVAWAEDGVIEAIEDGSLPFAVGVQWHPEAMYPNDEAAKALFESFVAAASNRSSHAADMC